ncbi:cytochrome b/b6 domain-containing protein [Demequina subtropica]|uniref:cytochrome b/b6 domain-containing protein n=1 Tax=Demequina subtropica TaxID=1638989 RepID=UPI0009E1F911|nr:cytochrome b/b6 domain-containing protein [Demequina subtropica]
MTPGVRRGLPRVPGGEPWPPARAGGSADAVGVALRRGLPRTPGGEPWPAAGFAPASVAVPAGAPVDVPVDEPAPVAPAPEAAPAAHEPAPVPIPAPRRMGRGGRAVIGLAVLLAVGGLVVLVARWLVSLDAVERFLETYPGTYPLPEGAPVGIPAWLSWQHFFNVFLLVLIVRTGLEVRLQQRPEAHWARRADPASRISLSSWTHQALDVLWVANGALYIVLLLATGQWMRIVPTSWSVFPNALSTALQYASLDWPAHDSWAYYNALQQLAYFVTVFIAAPLAIVTGVRMSIYWRGGPRGDRVYPKSVARALHFPVMVYFVAFVVGHVGLVLLTGARENLEHMYAASDAGGWLGVGIFLVSLGVIAGAVAALRPLLIAPVAGRFGSVSGR